MKNETVKTMVGELTTRYRRTEHNLYGVRNSTDIYNFAKDIFKDFKDDHERVYAFYMDTGNQICHYALLSSGGINQSVVDMRHLFRNALVCNAAAVILAHNHPSGRLIPSESDISLTKKAKIAGEHLDIKILDHIILGGDGYLSLNDEGYLP